MVKEGTHVGAQNKESVVSSEWKVGFVKPGAAEFSKQYIREYRTRKEKCLPRMLSHTILHHFTYTQALHLRIIIINLTKFAI